MQGRIYVANKYLILLRTMSIAIASQKPKITANLYWVEDKP